MSTNIPNYAEIHLPIWKQGDDFACAMENSSEDVSLALSAMAVVYRTAAAQLDKIRSIVDNLPRDVAESVEIDGDCHLIWVRGPQEVVDMLVAADLAQYVERDYAQDDDDEVDLGDGAIESGEESD